MVFRPAKVAVFIDGCYWHGCPEHYVAPKTNPGYWSDKVARNMARDRDTDQRLEEAGWTVLRFWEHEPSEDCAARIAVEVEERRKRSPKGKTGQPISPSSARAPGPPSAHR
jgi:DNA mismatch endonuclease (patch repair protein)